jgi:hypothetical protein
VFDYAPCPGDRLLGEEIDYNAVTLSTIRCNPCVDLR